MKSFSGVLEYREERTYEEYKIRSKHNRELISILPIHFETGLSD